MSVSNGRQFLSIPGPTNIPDAVVQAMTRPAIDLYTGEMIGITEGLLADLPRIFRTTGRVYLYAANGHGGWEAAFTNVLSRGDRVLVLESGRFAINWGDMARMMGAAIETLPQDVRKAVDPAAVEAHLRQDKAHAIKAILVVQIDTASGVVNDLPAIRKAIDNAQHPALLMVDAVASLGCMPFEMGAWGIDVAMTGSQKGLMTPPGIAIVAANAKAQAVHKTANMRTFYWDWTQRDGAEHYQKYAGTPPMHTVFGLRKALDMIFAEGLENVWKRHALLAEATRRAVEKWSAGEVLAFNISNPAERSNSVTNVLVQDRDPRIILDFAREKCGVALGQGIGSLAGKAFRIAHMGHTNAPMVLGTLGAIEIALKALGIAHGKGGVDAAVDYLGLALKV